MNLLSNPVSWYSEEIEAQRNEVTGPRSHQFPPKKPQALSLSKSPHLSESCFPVWGKLVRAASKLCARDCALLLDLLL